jgi:hypothetical protein
MTDLFIDHADAENSANHRQRFDRAADRLAVGNERSHYEVPAQGVQKNSQAIDECLHLGDLEKKCDYGRY